MHFNVNPHDSDEMSTRLYSRGVDFIVTPYLVFVIEPVDPYLWSPLLGLLLCRFVVLLVFNSGERIFYHVPSRCPRAHQDVYQARAMRTSECGEGVRYQILGHSIPHASCFGSCVHSAATVYEKGGVQWGGCYLYSSVSGSPHPSCLPTYLNIDSDLSLAYPASSEDLYQR